MKEKYRATGYSDLFSHTGFGSDPVHWFKFLWENKSEIDWRFIPKICFISVTILLTTPFILYERIALRKRIRQTEIAPPVFILGHPRSGTTYLHYILSCDSRFAFCNTYECFMPLIFFTFGGFIRKLFKASLPASCPLPLGKNFKSWRVFHTPGHTLGSVCLLKDGVLISGDSLFADGFGRTDFPGGDEFALARSLEQLEKMDWHTLLPGHGPVMQR